MKKWRIRTHEIERKLNSMLSLYLRKTATSGSKTMQYAKSQGREEDIMHKNQNSPD